jgi:hypothetical protein
MVWTAPRACAMDGALLRLPSQRSYPGKMRCRKSPVHCYNCNDRIKIEQLAASHARVRSDGSEKTAIELVISQMRYNVLLRDHWPSARERLDSDLWLLNRSTRPAR